MTIGHRYNAKQVKVVIVHFSTLQYIPSTSAIAPSLLLRCFLVRDVGEVPIESVLFLFLEELELTTLVLVLVLVPEISAMVSGNTEECPCDA